jgi:hypothetical protein
VLELICLNKPFLKLFWGRGKQMTKFIVEWKTLIKLLLYKVHHDTTKCDLPNLMQIT